MTTIARLFFLSALLGLFSAPLFADGLPPSEESACDVLNADGITPGLFGLCNAYCEAKDCDGYPEGEEPHSCGRLLANYENRAGESDPVMPCLQEEPTVCPCWPPETERLADGGMGLPAVGCLNNLPGIGTVIEYDDGTDMITFADTPGGCEYLNSLTEDLDDLETTPEEDAVCLADVVNLIDQDFGGLGNCFGG